VEVLPGPSRHPKQADAAPPPAWGTFLLPLSLSFHGGSVPIHTSGKLIVCVQ